MLKLPISIHLDSLLLNTPNTFSKQCQACGSLISKLFLPQELVVKKPLKINYLLINIIILL